MVGIDVLKAFAIIAVILFHLGICPLGYLGVDVFFVIAGYFTIKSLNKLSNSSDYVRFIKKRTFRLWPLIVIAGIFCIIWGYFFMMPDDYENLAQSVVASNFFANNILQCITTGNYWDVVNDYKPLMQMWYVGVLFQFYLFAAFLFFLLSFVNNRWRTNVVLWAIVVSAVISLALYFAIEEYAPRFYYLPTRLYEFCAGGFVSMCSFNDRAIRRRVFKSTFLLLYILLLILIISPIEFVPNVFAVPLTVVVTACVLTGLINLDLENSNLAVLSNKWVAYIGVASFSLFVWHQIVFAFTRYSFTDELCKFPTIAIILGLIFVLTCFSYKYIEQCKESKFNWWMVVVGLILSTGFSLYIYQKAGVIRDVPELGITRSNAVRGIWSKYCDRGYTKDKDFVEENKPHWFVIGNSFGRDFVNIILESSISKEVEVSYSSELTLVGKERRFKDADVIFISSLGIDSERIKAIEDKCNDNCRIYVVGEKNFGTNNGKIYWQRNRPDYFQKTIPMDKGYLERNEIFASIYKDRYIDLISMVMKPNGEVRVFSDDNMFISQDCRHLTQSGARFYAGIIDWNKLMQK